MKKILDIILGSLLLLMALNHPVFAATINSLQASMNAARHVWISGSFSSGANQQVTVQVVDPMGNSVYVNQDQTDINGAFSFQFNLQTLTSGNYQTKVGGAGIAVPSTIIINKNISPSNTQPAVQEAVQTAPLETTSPATPQLTTTMNTPVTVSFNKDAVLNADGVSISFPANALPADAKVTITQVVETSLVAGPEGSQLVSPILEIVKDQSGNFSKPVTIVLNFDKSNIDTDKMEIKICFYNEASATWTPLENINIDSAAGKASGEVYHFTKFAVLAFPKSIKKTEPAVPEAIKDIAGNWAEASIKQLVYKKIIQGYPDGGFKPNSLITRAEFIVAVVKAFKLTTSNGKYFKDITNHWAKDYIRNAAGGGIIRGCDETSFHPDDPVTREQMAVIIFKAAKLSSAPDKPFVDKSKISVWAMDGVAAASAAGLIKGYPDNSFKPQENATRAEASSILARGIQFQNM